MKHQQEPEKLPPIKTYIKRYFAYVEETGHRWCRITEPDMDIAGETTERVEGWREEMLERWPYLNITPVWHTCRGVDDWYRYIYDKRIKTLAMGSADFGDLGLSRRLILLAQQHGKPVHGFGMTRINTALKHLPVDSVDSTSWVMGQKAGTLYIFRNNKFITLPADMKNKRTLYRTYFRNIGCDPVKVVNDDIAEVRKANIIAWRALADRLEQLKLRGRQSYGIDHNVFAAQDIGELYQGRQHPPAMPKERERVNIPRMRERDPGSPIPTPKVRLTPVREQPQRRTVILEGSYAEERSSTREAQGDTPEDDT
jgi:hypothetical protein